ncbi:hypothetical protein MAR_009255 [Mya arenaria]|uniref:Uncharacterized protein n=1 Tax=Mya arenaria TaxID=6604 RepID=A0ABY7E1K5_MYAAR|nr:hypothetical protein MAR_009255 [Mya arenaria]
MERSAAEYLVYLRENVSDLKQEAKDMGLTEEEIKFCIDKALSLDSNQNELINSPKNIARKCFHYFRVLLKIWILACLLLIAAICGGFSQSVTASVVLRGLFPRPKVVPEKHEIPLEKHVFILGPNSPTFELPLTMHPIQLYIQGSGQRRLLARPHKNCRDSCNTLLAFMEPGDALMLQNDVWDGWVATGDGPSIGYLISIGI